MDASEKRLIGSLILLAGVTFLAAALHNGQLTNIIELMRSIFEPAVAGVP